MKVNIRKLFFIITFGLIVLTVYAQNNAPVVISNIPDLTMNEDTSDYSINLTQIFFDADGEPLTYTISGNNHIEIEIIAGLVILRPEDNWAGTETITFRATDPNAAFASDTAVITVTEVNDPPYIHNPLTSVSVTYAQPYTSFDLDNIFTDYDLVYGDDLDYTFSGNSNISVTISAANVVTFIPDFDFWGMEEISFIAHDEDNTTATQIVEVTVITPEIANVSVYPNPFSPDNDGQKDETTISFYVSANGTATLQIFPRDDEADIVYQDNSVEVTSGWNTYDWDGYGNFGAYNNNVVPDNGYGMRIQLGTGVYDSNFSIYVDTTPPVIDVMSAYPNPFSPNGDGYNDFHDIRYQVDGVRIEYIGLIHVNLWMEGHDPGELAGNYPYIPTMFIDEEGNPASYNDLNIAFQTLTDGGYLLAVRDMAGPSEVTPGTFPTYSLSPNAEYDLIVGDNGSAIYNQVQVISGLSRYKIGALQYPYLEVTGVGANDHEEDEDDIVGHDFFRLFVMEGNASFNIYNNDGTPYSLNNLFNIYYGDFQNLEYPVPPYPLYSPNFQYRATIPGVIPVPDEVMPDGRYIYRMIVTDQAGHAEEESGELLVNNYPIQVTATVTPTQMSPGNADGHYDHTVIQYQVTERAYVTVRIRDNETNEIIKTLRDGVDTPLAGYVIWDGKDATGTPVAQNDSRIFVVEITAQDKQILEDVVSEHIELTVDNEGPEAANIYLLNGQDIVTNPVVTIAGISNDVLSDILLYINGIYSGVIGQTPQYPGYFEFSATLNEGQNSLYVVLRDPSWNSGSPSNIVVIDLDSSAPQITITEPDAGDTIRTDTFRVRATVSDLTAIAVPPTSVKFGFSLDSNINTWYDAVQDINNPNSYYYDYVITNGIDQVTIDLTVRAADILGNIGITPEPLSFSYKRIVPPYILSHNPVDQSIINALPNSKISAVVQDNEGLGINQNDSGILLRDQNGSVIAGNKSFTSLGEDLYSINFTPTVSLITGVYSVITTVKDYFGTGSVTIDTVSFIYDNLNPVAFNLTASSMPITNDVILTNDITYIDMECSDTPAGVDFSNSTLKLYNNNDVEIPGTKSVTGNHIRWTLAAELHPDTNSGNYNVKYNIYDNAGNNVEQTVDFHLADEDSPHPAEVYPASNTEINNLISNQIVINFNNSTGTITLYNISLTLPNGTILSNGNGATSSLIPLTGNNYRLLLTLNNPLSLNGEHTVAYSITNSAGNSYSTSYHFIYDTQIPQIEYVVLGLDNEDFTYLNSGDEINNTVYYIQALLNDVYGIDYTSENTAITLLDEDNNELTGVLSVIGNALRLTLDTPLRAIQKNFTLNVAVQDNAGNQITEEYTFTVNTLNSVFYPEAGSFVNQPIDHVAFGFQYEEDIDFESSVMWVTHPDDGIIEDGNGATLQFVVASNGYIMNLNFNIPLLTGGVDDGRYDVNAIIYPEIGDSIAASFSFVYDTVTPYYTNLRANNSELLEIEDQFYFTSDITTLSVDYLDQASRQNSDVSGIDFSPNISLIYLTNEDGDLVDGTWAHTDDATVSWTLNNTLIIDGIYYIHLQTADNAGNVYNETIRFTKFTPIETEIESHNPANNAYVSNLTNNQLVVTVSENNGFGLNEDETDITLAGIAGDFSDGDHAEVTIEPIAGNNYRVLLSLENPLADDGSHDGVYSFASHIVDNAEGITDSLTHFTYDTQKPLAENLTVGFSGTPAINIDILEGMIVNDSLNFISVDFSDVTSAVDTDDVRTYIRLYNEDNQLVAGTRAVDGNTLNWNLNTLLHNDGSQDGLYYIRYSLVDMAGNLTTSQLSFRLLNPDSPQIIATYPLPGAELTVLIDNTFGVSFEDIHGINLNDFANNYIRITTPYGEIIEHQYHENTVQQISLQDTLYVMTLTMGEVLEVSGIYGFEFLVTNLAGYSYGETFAFKYDTEAPVIQNVYLVLTDDEEIEIQDDEDITKAVYKTKVRVSDAVTGIDFENEGNELVIRNSAHVELDGELDYNVNTSMLEFTLTDSIAGVNVPYEVYVKVFDQVGNAVEDTITFNLVDIGVEIVERYPSEIDNYINEDVTELTMKLDGPINENLTNITLTTPNGNISHGNGAELIFEEDEENPEITNVRLVLDNPLATDGSADGSYKAHFHVASVQNASTTINQNFTYDRTVPTYTDLKVNDEPVEGNKTRKQIEKIRNIPKYKDLLRDSRYIYTAEIDTIEVNYKDRTSDVNWESPNTKLYVVDENGLTYPGTNSDNTENDSLLIWTATTPITEDGLYTIKMKAEDYAGNIMISEYSFYLYIGLKPELVSYTPADLPAYMNSFEPPVFTAVFKDPSGILMDPDSTYIELIYPDSVVAHDPHGGDQTIVQNGEEYTITFTLDGGLHTNGEDDGVYTVTMRAVNTLGGVTKTDREMTYDTVKPYVAETKVYRNNNSSEVVTDNFEISGGISKIEVTYKDYTAGMYIIPNLTQATLADAESNIIEGSCAFDSSNAGKTVKVTWTLDQALALDGSDDGVYIIQMMATDKAGNVFTRNMPISLVTPNPPQNLEMAMDAVYNVHLSWDAYVPGDSKNMTRDVKKYITQNEERELYYYIVYRKYNNGTFDGLAMVSGESFVDDLQNEPDGTYTYGVSAVYSIGESDKAVSAPVTLSRFVNVTLNITVQDGSDNSGVDVSMIGDDGLYNMEFYTTTPVSGSVTFNNVFKESYIVTLIKEDYITRIDTISVDTNHTQFNFTLSPDMPVFNGIPRVDYVFQNYPNPFNPVTAIKFGLKEQSDVEIVIYDIKGKRVRALVEYKMDKGFHEAKWNGKDDYDKEVASGIYFYKFRATNNSGTTEMIKKMIMLK